MQHLMLIELLNLQALFHAFPMFQHFSSFKILLIF